MTKSKLERDLDLSAAIELVRSQLVLAHENSAGESLKFAVKEVEIQLEVAIVGSAKAGFDVKVLSFGTDISRTRTHTVKLVLEPRLLGDQQQNGTDASAQSNELLVNDQRSPNSGPGESQEGY